MPKSAIRVLVVEDYEPFRRFVCSTLRKRPELQIVGESSDGLEAVRNSEELQPNLIVLDIGLPSLNGIEAARRIREFSPESKILFVSQESSADVVQVAFSAGALGYVLKSHAGSELSAAVEAVLKDRKFVGSGLSGNPFTDTSNSRALDRPCRDEADRSLAMGRPETTRCHKAEFYSNDAVFVAGLTRFIEAALEDGNAVILVASESHRKSLLQTLKEHGVDIVAAVEERRYISLDVADTLSTFMVNDLPDPTRFLKLSGNLVAAAAKGSKGECRRVAACGECAPSLWEQGKADAAIQLEHLWDEVAKNHNVDILCGYVLKNFQHEQESHIYERICAEHSAVFSL
ncbi:MAG: response regulator [Terriglobales bacterium]